MGHKKYDRLSDVRFTQRFARKLEKELGLSDETDRDRGRDGTSESFVRIRVHLASLPDHLAAITLGRLVISLGGSLIHGEDWITKTYMHDRSRLDIIKHGGGYVSNQGPPGYGMLLDLAACAVLGARRDLAVLQLKRSFRGADFSGFWYHQIAQAWERLSRWNKDELVSFVEDKFSHRSAAFRAKLCTLKFEDLPRHLRLYERKHLVEALKLRAAG